MTAFSLNNAEWACLRWMADAPQTVNLQEDGREMEAMCAMFVALGLVRAGLCIHQKQTDAIAKFTITPAGRAALASDPTEGHAA